jgi:hypothetical protein
MKINLAVSQEEVSTWFDMMTDGSTGSGPPGDPEWWNGRGKDPWTEAYLEQRESASCDNSIEVHNHGD